MAIFSPGDAVKLISSSSASCVCENCTPRKANEDTAQPFGSGGASLGRTSSARPKKAFSRLSEGRMLENMYRIDMIAVIGPST